MSDRKCRGGCAECKALRTPEMPLAVFTCSACGEPVGWCEGGGPSLEDPSGDRCAACANAAHEALCTESRAVLEGNP